MLHETRREHSPNTSSRHLVFLRCACASARPSPETNWASFPSIKALPNSVISCQNNEQTLLQVTDHLYSQSNMRQFLSTPTCFDVQLLPDVCRQDQTAEQCDTKSGWSNTLSLSSCSVVYTTTAQMTDLGWIDETNTPDMLLLVSAIIDSTNAHTQAELISSRASNMDLAELTYSSWRGTPPNLYTCHNGKISSISDILEINQHSNGTLLYFLLCVNSSTSLYPSDRIKTLR